MVQDFPHFHHHHHPLIYVQYEAIYR